ncbi:MAG: hypothetical protein ACR2P7_07515, partial [bacterium]
VAPSAHAVTEICFDNTNRGGNMSFYIYPAKDFKRSSEKKIWEYTHESYHDPRRCVSVGALIKHHGAKWGDHVIGYYTAEGKAFGKAHFACPHMLTLTKSPIKRAVMTVTGTTIYNTKCKQVDEHKGRFLHPTNFDGTTDAGEICFDNNNHGALPNYSLYETTPEMNGAYTQISTEVHPNRRWASAAQPAAARPLCLKADQFKNVKPGTLSQIEIEHTSAGGIFGLVCGKVRLDPRSKATTVVTATGTTTINLGCQRRNYVHQK